jgi:acyl-CoA reductase-like NAD-dependent aldehyde dehydrogenase
MSNLVVDNPFTLETACTVELADEKTYGAALDRARAAARGWAAAKIADRVAICEKAVAAMEARAEEIAKDITAMMGKPLGQAKNEVAGMAGRARHMMAIAEESLADIVLPAKENFDRRIAKEPLGVVFDLPAWNYPLLTAVNAVIPALVAGNVVVLKHSPRSPLCGEHFARAFEQAGAPAGVLQALHCDHATSERIVGDARVDHVVFTGSIFGGHRITQAAAARFLHPTLELGGNDPAYVHHDVDLAKVADNIVDGACYNAGQSCCAVERVYVHKSVYAKFVEACESYVRAYVMGDPMDAKTTLGPIAQPHHVPELEAFVADAKERGARVVVGGKKTNAGGKGRFFEATLIADCTQSMKLLQAESFGPIVPICAVDSEEDAIAKMNDSRLGLTASVWTKDRELAAKMARRLDAGTVFMNRCDFLDPALPWSGRKDSGRGASLSALGYDALTRPKAIHFRVAL